MHQFLPEGLHPQPEGYTKEELLLAMQQRKILQAPAIKCDERHDLHIALGCCAGVMPRAEAARGILGGETRDIAILSRVGRPVCFTVMGFAPDGTALLSRRSAQEAALEQIFREKRPGDILPAVVTGLAPFGAFCDIGCGAVPCGADRDGDRLWKNGLWRVYCADTESVRAGRTGRYTGTRPAGMRVHQGHSPGDAQAEADRPAPAGHSASAAATLHEDGRTAGCVAVRKPGEREDRDGVLTLG